MKYEKLFEKGKIGKLTLKNRIVMTPMGTGFAAASGEASEEITKFYEERELHPYGRQDPRIRHKGIHAAAPSRQRGLPHHAAR